jgi:Lrp/AsnC family leucine-responsive transcriptional regulator
MLQNNARVPNSDIARQIGMAPSGVLERIRKLEARGIIKGYETRIDPKALDLDLVAFVFVQTKEYWGCEEAAALLSGIPGVQEVHNIAGEDCYLMKMRAADTESLWARLKEHLGPTDLIQSTRTTVVLNTVKESTELPLTEE